MDIFEQFKQLNPESQKAVFLLLLSQCTEWSVICSPQMPEKTFDDACSDLLDKIIDIAPRPPVCSPTGLKRTMKKLPDWTPTAEQLAPHLKRMEVNRVLSELQISDIIQEVRQAIAQEETIFIEQQRKILEHQNRNNDNLRDS